MIFFEDDVGHEGVDGFDRIEKVFKRVDATLDAVEDAFVKLLKLRWLGFCL